MASSTRALPRVCDWLLFSLPYWAGMPLTNGVRSPSMALAPSRIASYPGPIASSSHSSGKPPTYSPWTWLLLIVALLKTTRTERNHSASAADRFFLFHTAIPLVVFLIPACVRTLLPHWTLAAFLSAIPLAGHEISIRCPMQPTKTFRSLRRMALALFLISGFLLLQSRFGFLQQTSLHIIPQLPATSDPTVDLVGWSEVVEEIERLRLLNEDDTFLFTSRWYFSGQLANVVHNRAEVFCYNPGDSHAFSQWSHPEAAVGRDGILVTIDRKFHRADGLRSMVRLNHPHRRLQSLSRADTNPPRSTLPLREPAIAFSSIPHNPHIIAQHRRNPLPPFASRPLHLARDFPHTLECDRQTPQHRLRNLPGSPVNLPSTECCLWPPQRDPRDPCLVSSGSTRS